MDTQNNDGVLINELRWRISILEQLIQNQSAILGTKDLVIYRLNEKVDDLEFENDRLKEQATNLLELNHRRN